MAVTESEGPADMGDRRLWGHGRPDELTGGRVVAHDGVHTSAPLGYNAGCGIPRVQDTVSRRDGPAGSASILYCLSGTFSLCFSRPLDIVGQDRQACLYEAE